VWHVFMGVMLLSTCVNFRLFAFLSKAVSVDKCINKPFKNKVCSQYQAWMVNGQFTYTPFGKKQVQSEELALQWIHKAWQEIPAHLVANAFNDRLVFFSNCDLKIFLQTVLVYKVNPNFGTNLPPEEWFFLKNCAPYNNHLSFVTQFGVRPMVA